MCGLLNFMLYDVEFGELVVYVCVVSDCVIFVYFCDVFVIELWCGEGFGCWLMECVVVYFDL